MLDFQEELEKFKPSREVGDMEDVIIGSDTVDVADIIMEIIKEDKRQEAGSLWSVFVVEVL